MNTVKFRYCVSCKKKFPHRPDEVRVYCHSCLKRAAAALKKKENN